jgi:hypothetical protein
MNPIDHRVQFWHKVHYFIDEPFHLIWPLYRRVVKPKIDSMLCVFYNKFLKLRLQGEKRSDTITIDQQSDNRSANHWLIFNASRFFLGLFDIIYY